MTYTVTVWEQSSDAATPESPEDAEDSLGRLELERPGQNPKFLALAGRLTAQFPCITSPEAQDLPESLWAWTEGPLDGVTQDAVLEIGIRLERWGEVLPLVVRQANALGLNVRDGLSTDVFLADGTVLYAEPHKKEPADKGVHAFDLGNYELALRELLPLAEKGNARARTHLGMMYSFGYGVPKSDDEAVKWLTLAAEQKHDHARMVLANKYMADGSPVQNYPEALRLLSLVAKKGDAKATHYLATLYDRGLGMPRDLAKAIQLYKRAAERGDSEAQNALGSKYLSGTGILRDNAKAVQWFLAAARQNHHMAQRNLGVMYRKGAGVQQNPVEAAMWFRAAIRNGSTSALALLGQLHEHGTGVDQDIGKAIDLYRRAIEAGYAPACCSLGDVYRRGQYVDQDFEEAVKWFRLGAAKSDASSLSGLGLAYLHGDGVPKNRIAAYALLKRFAEQGEKNRATYETFSISREATPQEVEAGEALKKEMETSGAILDTLDRYVGRPVQNDSRI